MNRLRHIPINDQQSQLSKVCGTCHITWGACSYTLANVAQGNLTRFPVEVQCVTLAVVCYIELGAQ